MLSFCISNSIYSFNCCISAYYLIMFGSLYLILAFFNMVDYFAVLDFTIQLVETGFENDVVLALLVFSLQYVLVNHEIWSKVKHARWKVTLKVFLLLLWEIFTYGFDMKLTRSYCKWRSFLESNLMSTLRFVYFGLRSFCVHFVWHSNSYLDWCSGLMMRSRISVLFRSKLKWVV